MTLMGMKVEVDYCTGCEVCILACQQEHGYEPEQYGVRVTKLGPLHINDEEKVFQYDFIPQFTQWCALRAERTAKGKKPSCVQHCQAQCLELGPIEELSRSMNPKDIIVALDMQ